MELPESPPSCPKTVTVRRNPHRRARDTPLVNIPLLLPTPTPLRRNDIPSFPIDEILSIDAEENENSESVSENLKVYLRIRPVIVQSNTEKKAKIGAENASVRNAWPRNPRSKGDAGKKVKKSSEICVTVNDSHSVMLIPPPKLQNSKRVKSEIYEGFSFVFPPEASQNEVYEKMVKPLVDEFMRGKSRMLAALGPSGSGKTHTIFGTGKDPGMVTRALRQMFSEEDDRKTQSSRTFHLSMFEICSEKGKAEKILDLSQDGTEVCTPQTSIKGLQETRVYDLQQAESIIARGLLRRATAMTNSNSQSSRSQCIINIRCDHKNVYTEAGENIYSSASSVMTIVDLAGAERERKTGNQGARLLESNFINNTSMVFGQCLRCLLEHQKNPRKPLQKHFQNSMLTRYLRDYLEGKKRMALLLTARPGEEDYLDTSFLLRQASPYTKIKFDSIEEPVKFKFNKRPSPAMPMSEQLKRMKTGDIEANNSGGVQKEKGSSFLKEELTSGEVDGGKLTDILSQSEEPFVRGTINDSMSPGVYLTKIERRDREYQVLLGFSKAVWNVLKDYKRKLEVAENEIHCLREELKDFKTQHSFQITSTAKISSIEDHQSTNTEEITKSSEDTAVVEYLKSQDVEAEDISSECQAPGAVLVTDSYLCTDQRDETSKEKTDLTPMKSTTKSSQLLNDGECQLKNEVVKNTENETCTTDEEFQDSKRQHSSDVKASVEVPSTENHSLIHPQEDAVNKTCTSNEEFQDLKCQHSPDVTASAEVLSTEKQFSIDCQEDAENETCTSNEEFQDLKCQQSPDVTTSAAVPSTENRCSIGPQEDAENEPCTFNEEFQDLKCLHSSDVTTSAAVPSTENRCSIDPQEDAENETCTSNEEFQDLKCQHSSDITASAEVSSAENHCSVDSQEDAENETHISRVDFIDLVSDHSTESIASAEESTENHSLVAPEDRLRESTEDPKLEDVEVEHTLECKAPRNPLNMCQDTDQGVEKIKERKSDSILEEFTANTPRPPNNIKCQPRHEEEKDAENQTCISREDFIDLESHHSTESIASAEESTENHCLVALEDQLRESPEDPKLEDVEVEDTLECKETKIPFNMCQCTDQEVEKTKRKDSTLEEFTANTPRPPKNIKFQPRHTEEKKHVHPSSTTKDVRTCNPRNEESNPRNADKPKRRLLPASSVLLKDIGSVDFIDENEKTKGKKKEKKKAEINVKNRSEGSIALIRLLTNQNR